MPGSALVLCTVQMVGSPGECPRAAVSVAPTHPHRRNRRLPLPLPPQTLRLRNIFWIRRSGMSVMKAIDLETRYSAPNYSPLPVVLARGEGAYLWDTSGRCYVDMMSAYSAASHGHAHPRILAALE